MWALHALCRCMNDFSGSPSFYIERWIKGRQDLALHQMRILLSQCKCSKQWRGIEALYCLYSCSLALAAGSESSLRPTHYWRQGFPVKIIWLIPPLNFLNAHVLSSAALSLICCETDDSNKSQLLKLRNYKTFSPIFNSDNWLVTGKLWGRQLLSLLCCNFSTGF